MSARHFTREQQMQAVEDWYKLRLAGLSGKRASSKLRMSQATLSRWAQKHQLPLPKFRSARRAARRYGELHVLMRSLQRKVVPLRAEEIRYVESNIDATCRTMPSDLRILWERAIQKANGVKPPTFDAHTNA